MNKTLVMAMALLGATPCAAQKVNIGKSNIQLKSDLMTPEALWAMGRIGSPKASPDGRSIVYQVGYYSVAENRGHQVICVTSADGKQNRQLTTSADNETDPAWSPDGKRIFFLTNSQLWSMAPDGSDRRQLTHDATDIEGFKLSPDGKKVVLVKSIPYHGSIKKNPDDLPKATGRLVTDMNYRHWDHYVESIPHPFVADIAADGTVGEGTDILKGEPYESPMAPFGGVEQLDWSTDSKTIAYTCRKKEGVAYANSTDADIYLFDTQTGSTRNICKPEGYKEPAIDYTKSLAQQAVNHQQGDMMVGYDVNPRFSPDGQYIAWQSMRRDGYESDLNRLCVMSLKTGKKTYVVDSRNFDSNVDDYCWSADSKSIYFIGVWHATEMVYQVSKLFSQNTVTKLTDGVFDYGSVQLLGRQPKLLLTRHSMLHPDDIYTLALGSKKTAEPFQVTDENAHIFKQLALPTVEQRWVATTDGKKELVWIILPPHFDAKKKYPTLLYCEGGPQSPVSQFWSYRWNFSIMAAHGYVIVAPNRRGLPGFGSEWNEEISGDWTGQCMNDYLSAIDDAANNLPYVDRDRMGAVGASFGGFSVYYLAGHHNKRFKCFIAHDGAFNLESMYTDTEEGWFSNWEYDDAYWNKDQTERARKTYANSPHKAVDNWDTPILCIHGEKDYRINANQGMGAFNAARMKGIPAELLIFPDENHWVLKPQNGILWQRTFFNWLDRWLKQK